MKLQLAATATLMLALSAMWPLAEAQQPRVNGGAATSVQAADEPAAAIQKTAKAFAEAFNRGDAKAIAALWTPSGEYIDESATAYAGREAIENRYADFFKANPGASIALEVDSVRLLSSDAAIEDGHAVLTLPAGGESTAGAYSVVHVQIDGRWLMASVRDAPTDGGTAQEHIADLQWLIGTWTAEEQGVTMESVCKWIGEKSFVERRYTTKAADGVQTSGVQIIGWNAQAQRVQSWNFSADGSFAVGIWTPIEGGWHASVSGVTVDGAATSAVNQLRRLDDNAYVWQSVDRSVNAIPLPDSDEVIMRRLLQK
ncbi:MAG: SgcJ/EcaC family oxidoreductase [Planctomycetaceae bacterium]|uniref:SnoaL-like domain protein n=1 Tax=Lacipirellula limnantheis TaxID=2528024 RepID=A0A517TZ23_9BACT|nr:SgcJ/EcaC family oxidoreductase [Lacipirellula limnantheis]MBL9164302.1 SgcJ/EcaC family oxidoreductase [Planctomycetaceae bacterium]QDT73624.1 SnoaL-like domain protein [Lacipirellula limnantheis]